jgi:hypothetical protein
MTVLTQLVCAVIAGSAASPLADVAGACREPDVPKGLRCADAAASTVTLVALFPDFDGGVYAQPPLPHLRRDWAHPCHVCTAGGCARQRSPRLE